jgi:phosphate transport system substrate-binding protein
MAAAAAWAVAPSMAKAAEITPIVGAGSSFIDPVVRRWLELLPAAMGVRASYDPIGSGNGRNRVLAGDVDFGASDEPMPADKLANGNLLQFPLVFGGIVCAVNIPGITDNQLVLTAPLLGAIYAGAIKKWNDPNIVAENPGLSLPDVDIHPMSEGTPNGPMPGTTFNFTQYLLATNPDWRAKYGPAITKRWAVGSMAANNAFMVETIKVLPGSIGYMSFAAAAQAKVARARLRNRAGKPVEATSAALAAATVQADWAHSPNLVVNLLDLPGEESWPIVIATYALVPKEPKHTDAMRNFLRFIINEPTAAPSVLAAPMPPSVRAAAMAMLGITDS